MRDYQRTLQEGNPSHIREAIEEREERIAAHKLSLKTIATCDLSSSIAKWRKEIEAIEQRIAWAIDTTENREEKGFRVERKIRTLEHQVKVLKAKMPARAGSVQDVARAIVDSELDTETLRQWCKAIEEEILDRTEI